MKSIFEGLNLGQRRHPSYANISFVEQASRLFAKERAFLPVPPEKSVFTLIGMHPLSKALTLRSLVALCWSSRPNRHIAYKADIM